MARLKYNGNKATTKTGLQLTKAEVTKFRNLKTKINAKRRYMTNKYETMQPQSMLKNGHDIIFRPPKASKGFDDFETKEQFNEYMRRMKKWGSTRYSSQQTSMYKTNFNKALIEAFGHTKSNHLRKMVTNMSDSKFREMIVKYPLETSIGFVYYEKDDANHSSKYMELEKIISRYSKS